MSSNVPNERRRQPRAATRDGADRRETTTSLHLVLGSGARARRDQASLSALRLEVLDDESGAVKQFVERDDLRAMGMMSRKCSGAFTSAILTRRRTLRSLHERNDPDGPIPNTRTVRS